MVLPGDELNAKIRHTDVLTGNGNVVVTIEVSNGRGEKAEGGRRGLSG
jgi:hypothetical protein